MVIERFEDQSNIRLVLQNFVYKCTHFKIKKNSLIIEDKKLNTHPFINLHVVLLIFIILSRES